MNVAASYIPLMNKNLITLFRTGLGFSKNDPKQVVFFLKTLIRQRLAVIRRHRSIKRGVPVPPYLIASVTQSCNLRCAGCYARGHGRAAAKELKDDRWIEILSEASRLGVSVSILAGGEPFTRKSLLSITRHFPNMIFPVFTNGILIDDVMIDELRNQKHVIPVVSLEGDRVKTDGRRGKGVFEQAMLTLEHLRKQGIFFGVSITVTNENMDFVTRDAFIQKLVDGGCGILFFIEFVPVENKSEHLVLSMDQRNRLNELVKGWDQRFRALFVAFPGDEEQYGGCLAAGRGFVHISADGRLEPCPFAPYTDTSLVSMNLEQALRSRLLAQIRENHNQLTETRGGCALWTNRDWVKSLIEA
jgi:MoaA/NifB/PqqE/SkfB family radical SAM enzyme